MSASASPQSPSHSSAWKSYSLMQAASILEVHRTTLSKWIDQGCPVLSRADRDRGVEWEISIADVMSWRIQRAVEDALATFGGESGQISKDEAQRRKAVANAITAEIEADEALRSVVSRHAAESDMAAFCQVLRTGLSNASSRIASRATSMANASEVEDLCHAELNRAFEAADVELAARWSGERHGSDDGSDEDQPPS